MAATNRQTAEKVYAGSRDVLWQVRRRSVAERAGVKVGDVVLAINDVNTSSLTHRQMLELISHHQLTLHLTLSRSGEVHSFSIADPARLSQKRNRSLSFL